MMHHFKEKSLQFLVFNFIRKLTLANNLWQCLEQNVIQLVWQKIPFILFFLNEEFIGLKSIKGQFWDVAVQIL